jgi:2-polyprenyl-3-methyl-5-hydroxy-6-metoxy-1,4-benzoquinol methylase
MPLLRIESRAGIQYSVQRQYSEVSVNYYNQNAEGYFADTVGADVHHLRSKFLTHVPAGGDILDAGCGSGRDALAFHKAGYHVIAFDASAEMCRKAREYTDLPVI